MVEILIHLYLQQKETCNKKYKQNGLLVRKHHTHFVCSGETMPSNTTS